MTFNLPNWRQKFIDYNYTTYVANSGLKKDELYYIEANKPNFFRNEFFGTQIQRGGSTSFISPVLLSTY